MRGKVIRLVALVAALLALLGAVAFGTSSPASATPAVSDAIVLPDLTGTPYEHAKFEVLGVQDGKIMVDGLMGPAGCTVESAPCNVSNNAWHNYGTGDCSWSINLGNYGNIAYANHQTSQECSQWSGVNMKSAYGSSNTWLAGGCDRDWAVGGHNGPVHCFLEFNYSGFMEIYRNRTGRVFTMMKVQNGFQGLYETDFFS